MPDVFLHRNLVTIPVLNYRKKRKICFSRTLENLKMSKNRTRTRAFSPQHPQTKGNLAPGYLNHNYCSQCSYKVRHHILNLI